MFKGLLQDARLIAQRDPAAKSTLEVILLYPGFQALFSHRIAHWLFKKRLFFLARFTSQFSRFFTGIEVHPGAVIGRGLFMDHGMGIVIGETAEIGDNCTIYHGVTLGGTGKDKGKRHPTIGNNVLIGAGAQLLGPITVGDNAMIGAGSVVLDGVEAGTTVTGSKARAVKRAGRKLAPSIELDQVHIGDPVSQELCRLQVRIEHLEAVLRGETVKEEDFARCCKKKAEANSNTGEANSNTGEANSNTGEANSNTGEVNSNTGEANSNTAEANSEAVVANSEAVVANSEAVVANSNTVEDKI